MYFQWYPGNMAKARRMMREELKLVDLIIELVDARIPFSGRNPDIDILGKNKARLVILNKADLANEECNDAWVRYFRGRGCECAKADSARGTGIKPITGVIQKAFGSKAEKDRKRGIKNRPVRAMVVGIPNVGKSTFINTMAGKARARTGNAPGVTRDKQWIRLNKNVELLDTPGILPPKFDRRNTGLMLALTGSVKDDMQDAEEICAKLIEILAADYPGALKTRYGIEEPCVPYGCLKEIALKRGCLAKGSEPDLAKAARLILDDFKRGRLGRITLEKPPGQQ